MTRQDEEHPAHVSREFRLWAWSALLAALAFAQSPGWTVTDTKLDLVVAPSRFLSRAWEAWDPLVSLGQLQNQAYGYLFPMGPFFAGLEAVHLPAWVIQRLWWALLLVVAFQGMARLSRHFGVSSTWAQVACGIAFALSPRMITVLGPSSVEVWPMAMAPWVLLPLVAARTSGQWRRGALFSGVLVGAVGGVNAAATSAVLPLAALWLLMFTPAGSRARTWCTWAAVVALSTSWWLVPLFVLGLYSAPFLDFIESASGTTFAANAFDALRGTTNWVPYVDTESRGGAMLLTDPLVIVSTAAVAGLGLIGMTLSRGATRDFLFVGGGIGLFLVTVGHTGPLAGPAAESMQDLLDGVLAPLRNTHKFDVVLRIPLVLGFGVLLTRIGSLRVPFERLSYAATVVLLLVSSTVPAWAGRIAPADPFAGVPDHWAVASQWLESNAEGSVLLSPPSKFGQYSWGKTSDEPVQALLDHPWITRSLVPLTPGATVETLDAISAQLATGQGSAGLYSTLARAGIGTIVIRHDLDRAQDVISPEAVRSALSSTPRVSKVAEFGPEVGGEPTIEGEDGRTTFVDGGWSAPRPAIEIFRLDDVGDSLRTESESSTPTFIGDAMSLLAADTAGLTRGSPVLLAQDSAVDRPRHDVILTDGNRDQEINFGSVNHGRSATLSPGEQYHQDRPVHSYLPDDAHRWRTSARLLGAESVTASSARSDVTAVPFTAQEHQAWSAFDDDSETSWSADPGQTESRAYVQITFSEPTNLGRVRIVPGGDEGTSRELTVSTERGDERIEASSDRPNVVDVGTVSSLRISGHSSLISPLQIVDVQFDHAVARPLALPALPQDWGTPAAISLTRADRATDGCLVLEGLLQCQAEYRERGEVANGIDRIVTLNDEARYEVGLRYSLRSGNAAQSLLQRGGYALAQASSQASSSSRGGAVAAADDDPGTGWFADPEDERPWYQLDWLRAQRIDGLRIDPGDLAVSVPKRVSLRFDDGELLERRVVDGRVSFPERRAESVRIYFDAGDKIPSVSFDGIIRALPFGAAEITAEGRDVPAVFTPDTVELGCGEGPVVDVNGRRRETSARIVPDRGGGDPSVTVHLCGRTVRLSEGENRINALPHDVFRAEAITLLRRSPQPSGTLHLSRYVWRTTNTNTGWRGSADGVELQPVTVNGWQQGFAVPAGVDADDVTWSFAPERVQRWGLGLGLGVFGSLVAVALWTGTRVPRRVRPGSLRSPRVSRWLISAVLVFLGVAVFGAAGAIASVVVAVLPRLRGVTPVRLRWVAAVALTVGAIAAAVLHWGAASGWAGEGTLAQLSVLAALTSCLAVSRCARP